MPSQAKMPEKRIFFVLMVLLTSACAAHWQETGTRVQQSDLLYQPDLVYKGAFRLPSGSSDRDSFAYGGTALAYNPSRDSLFIVGHDWHQLTAEISIPKVVNSTRLDDLKTAILLQPLTDVTEGHILDIKANGTDYPGSVKIGGLLVYRGNLIGTLYGYYDAGKEAELSHFASGLDLSVKEDFKGVYSVGTLNPAFVAGYMSLIPPEWQAAFGGPALTGNCCLSIISRTSLGPAASVFDPGDLGRKSPVPSKPVLGYPIDHPTLGAWESNGTSNLYFNMATEVKGLVFPAGTGSIIFFGRQGLGIPCYGEGSNKNPPSRGLCYDPASSSKGTHAYPYANWAWAYDVNDLIDVKNGDKDMWEIKPYAVWQIRLPFEPAGNGAIRSAAYDPATQRIFISQAYGDGSSEIIHVFQVNMSLHK